MTLSPPPLYDRKFQDIFDEARRDLIPHYCPQWTDHNLSDPGITLVELFAWMMETLLYRLNRVPLKSLITFLNLMGVGLEPPQAATADVTFTITTPQDITIPKGTELKTERKASEEPLTFTTAEDLIIKQPILSNLWATAAGETWIDLEHVPEYLPLFSTPPRKGDEFYIGFENDISHHTLRLSFDVVTKDDGSLPDWPNIQWERWNPRKKSWAVVESEKVFSKKNPTELSSHEGTSDLVLIQLFLPPSLKRNWFHDRDAFWLRAVVLENQEIPVVVHKLRAEGIGGTVKANNETVFENEELGRSNGKPGQSFQALNQPILIDFDSTSSDMIVDVEIDDNGIVEKERWEVKDTFASSKKEDRHCVCDPATGTIRFGPAIVCPNGSVEQHGMTPPEGARIKLSRYRSGGGARGNVGAGTLIHTTVPGIASVTNRAAATGGYDLESLEHAAMRSAQILRTRDRAVTAEDFEFLALQASKSIARARCLASIPQGKNFSLEPVKVLLVPAVGHVLKPTDRDLAVPDNIKNIVYEYLKERSLLCTRFEIDQPNYIKVVVNAGIEVDKNWEPENVKEKVEEALYKFLHPVCGGIHRTGWPFGQSLAISYIHDVILRVPGVKFVKFAELRRETKEKKVEEDIYHILLSPNDLLASAMHVISTKG